MSTVMKLGIIILCGWVLLGAMKQVSTDFSNIRASNQEHIERAIDNCR